MANFLQGLFGAGQTEDQNDFRRQIGFQLGQPRTASPVGALSALIGGSLVGQANRQSDKFTADAKKKQDDFRKLLGESLAGGDTTKIMQALVSSEDPNMMSLGVKLALEQAGGDAPLIVGGSVLDPKTFKPLYEQPQKAQRPTRLRPGDSLVGDDGQPIYTAPGKVGGSSKPTASAEREGLADRYGLTGDAKTRFVLTGQMPATAASAGSATENARKDRNTMAVDNLLTSIDMVEELAKGMNTGPLIGGALAYTEKGQKLQTEVASIVSSLRALQRVPGSGADTDKELEIILKQAPSLTFETEANMYAIKRLREKAKAYAERMKGGGQPQAPAVDTSDDDLINKYLQ